MAKDPIITGANRPTMGTGPYTLGAGDRSASDVRKGMVVRKKNAAGGSDPGGGTATHRGQIMAATLGAQYRITAKLSGYSETDANVQANGRIVPAVTGSVRNFRSAGG